MTVSEMIKAYNITLDPAKPGMLRAYNVKKVKADNAMKTIAEAKPEIMAILTAEKEAKEKAIREREEKIAAIEGLSELEAAIAEHEKYHYDFNRAMENGNGVLPNLPKSDIPALKEKYPRAAAYVKAYNWTLASHFVKCGAGRKALERIINGEDYSAAIRDMEKEFSDYCNEHIWD